MNNLELIVNKIKRDKGFDLSGYKSSTLKRRIERRMEFDKAGSLAEYARMIDKDYHLYWRLIGDFFIGVTDFSGIKRFGILCRREYCRKSLLVIARRLPKAADEAIPRQARNDSFENLKIKICFAFRISCFEFKVRDVYILVN